MANDENIKRIKKSHHIFIDGTFHHPPGYKQLLLFMYKVLITDLKIPCFYVLLNGKYEIFYDYIFDSIYNIITNNNTIKINFQTIVCDGEIALNKIIKKYFPDSHIIICYFHYTQDIISNKIIKTLSVFPILYKGDISFINKTLKNICNEYPKYTNFIENYFKINKLKYFIDDSLNYSNIPIDCRTNNFIENYNSFIKLQLGKNRTINWVNFLHFIKSESVRNIEKLIKPNTNHNFVSNNEINTSTYNQVDINNKINISKNSNNLLKEISICLKELNSMVLNEDNIIHTKVGIENIGNSCYINAILLFFLVFIPILLDFLIFDFFII